MLRLALLAAAVLANRVNGDLRSRLNDAGVQAVFPGDPNYEQLSEAFNLRFSYLPAAIALPDSAEQVAATVQAGVAENVNVNARGGGHSYSALSVHSLEALR